MKMPKEVADNLELGTVWQVKRPFLKTHIKKAYAEFENTSFTRCTVTSLAPNEYEQSIKLMDLCYKYGEWIRDDMDITTAIDDPALDLLIKAKEAVREGAEE